MTIQELMILTKLRNVDSYESMSKQQLQSIFTVLSAPNPLQNIYLFQDLKSINNYYKPKKITDALDDNYIECH